MSTFNAYLKFFFVNDTATTEIYTLSLHDALPIFSGAGLPAVSSETSKMQRAISIDSTVPWQHTLWSSSCGSHFTASLDRKSTRLNSSHANISYAVFCLKKKQALTRLGPLCSAKRE